MKIHTLHEWQVTPHEARAIQDALRRRVITHGRVRRPRVVAGADLAYDTRMETLFAAVVVLRFPSLELIECHVRRDRVTFPYVPGLLSFREVPSLLPLFRSLRQEPDVILVDGHGVSHPRRMGLASHLGVLLDRPVIGCAKSRLTGHHDEPGLRRGAMTDLRDQEERVIGKVLRTRDRVKPVYVSVGHRLNLSEAVRLTLACGKGFRLPEPTRQADLLAERAKRDAGR